MFLKVPNGYLLLGGIFFIFDRVFKWLASTFEGKTWLLHRYFGWEPFFNKGVAFGIELPKILVIFLTLFIVASVCYFFYLNGKTPSNGKEKKLTVGLMMILAGAASNLVDRLLFDYTIDYIRVFNGVINFADIFIIVGFVLYFSSLKQEAQKHG